MKDKKYRKVRDHCHYTEEYRSASHSICNLKYSIPEKIPIAFYNESNYGYNFIINELAGELKKQLTCLGENTEKYITFTVPKEKETTRGLIKMETKLQKIYLTYHNLFRAQDLWLIIKPYQ